MSLTVTCRGLACDPCCGWWDFDSQVPDLSSIAYTPNVLVDLTLFNKRLCSIGFGIWSYRITDMTFMGGASDEIVWNGPYIDPAHPAYGPPSGCTVTFYYSYQGTIVFQVVGQNIYVGTAPPHAPANWMDAYTPARWWGSGISIPEYGIDGSGHAVWVADHGFYTQWDLPMDKIPPSQFPMKQDPSVYADYRGWLYDGPTDKNDTQVINIESAMVGPITGVTDSAIVAGQGPWVYPLTYFYASGGTGTAGSPL